MKIDDVCAAMSAMFDTRFYVAPGNATTGISWAFLDDEGFVLLKNPTRAGLLREMEAFRAGMLFGSTLDA